MTPDPHSPIGIFDSGLGGVSVWREIARLLPAEATLYIGDTRNLPYGPRPPGEIRSFSLAIVRRLLDRGAKLVVVACNTASAAALGPLRAAFPAVPIVGMEPAVKPAAAGTRTGTVGVLATEATLQGELFAGTVARFARGTRVLRQPCPGLAHCIETRPADDPALIALLEKFIRPLLDQGVDNLVLGCTHYPLITDAIARIAGPGVRIIDPGPAIARRVQALLEERNLLRSGPPQPPRFAVTGDPEAFRRALERITGTSQRVERENIIGNF